MSRIPFPSRTFVGLGLVVASLAGVGFVVNESQQTRVVAVTATEIIAGQRIAESDVVALVVPQGSVFDGYAHPTDFSDSPVARQSLGSGQLVPKGILGFETLSDDSVITIELSIGSPDWLRAGAVTELWVAPPGAENTFLAPFVLAPEVSILKVSKDEGFAADTLRTRVEVLVPRRHLPGAIHALANRYFLHLSPIDGPRP